MLATWKAVKQQVINTRTKKVTKIMHKHGCAGTVHQGKRENKPNLLKYT